jgi:hypothetical protein
MITSSREDFLWWSGVVCAVVVGKLFPSCLGGGIGWGSTLLTFGILFLCVSCGLCGRNVIVVF